MTRVRLIATIFGWMLASSVMARAVKWTSYNLDPFGYSDISKLNCPANLFQSIRIADYNALKIYPLLVTEYEKHDDNAFVAYGLMFAACKCGKASDALELIANHYAKKRISTKSSTDLDRFTIAFKLGIAMASSMSKDSNQSIRQNKLNAASKLYYTILLAAIPNSKTLTREHMILYSSASYVLQDLSGARKVLRSYVDRNKSDSLAHLLLSRLYGSGSLSRTDGSGRHISVSDGERVRADLAKDEAVIAQKLDPRSPFANYEAGLYCKDTFPGFTKKCWELFLNSPESKDSPEAREYVTKWLSNH